VPEQDTPTQFIGGIGKRMLNQVSSNGKTAALFKAVLPWLLFLSTAFMLATDRWIGTTEKAVASTTRIQQLEKVQDQQIALAAQSYARRDLMEVRMTAFEKGQDEVKAQLAEIQKTVTALLLLQQKNK
jgi:TM2 domain-containing membrane protein YozV